MIIATRHTRQFIFELDNPVDGAAYIFIRRPGEAPIEATTPHLFQLRISMPDSMAGDTTDYRDIVDVCMAMYRYRKVIISCDSTNSIRRGTLRCFLEYLYPVNTGYQYKFDKKLLSHIRNTWSAATINDKSSKGDRKLNRNFVNCVLEDGRELTAVVYEDRDAILSGMIKGANLLDITVGRMSIDEFDLVVGNVKTYSSSKNLVSHIKSLSKCDQTH